MGEYTRTGDGVPNLFGLTQFDGKTQFFDGDTYALPQVAGWVIVCGFGVFFACIALILVWIDVKFAGHNYNSEQFNTAGRSVKAGLIGVDIVSHFTWASILLACVSLTYLNGVSNSMWFANQGLNTFLFAMMSLELKHRAPKAHTFLEIIQCRWGTTGHLVFGFIAFMTNFIVTIMMVMGAVVVTNVLTGVNSYALSILIPMGVVLYAVSGGLKATFTTSYIHTVIIFVVLCVFMFKTYCGGGELGSISKVHERLVLMGPYKPIPGNRAGSYLTAFSLQGFYSNINGIIIGLVQIFADQSYWQSAVAASPIHAVKGYIVGTYLYFAIVFSLPICMGLAAVAMDLPLSGSEASNGLVLPAVAITYFGQTGAVLVVIICFMAVTSSGAGEGLACTSLFTYDVYRRYIKPKASGKELLLVSRLGVIGWGLLASALCCMCTGAYISYNFMGDVLSVTAAGAVFPIFFSLLWNGCTCLGATIGTITGGCCGIIAWLVTAKEMYEAPTVLSLQNNEPMLAGCCISIFMGLIVCVVLSKLFPAKEKFDWRLFDHDIHLADKGERLGITQEGVDSAAYIAKMRKYVWAATAVFFVATQFVWPLLSLPAGAVWSLHYFTLWVVIGFFLLISATLIAIILPIWEARGILTVIFKHMFTWTTPKEALKYDGTEYSHHPDLVDGGRLPNLDRKPSKPMSKPYVENDDTAHGQAAVAQFKSDDLRQSDL